MPKPLIFISHSAKADPLAKKVLNKLCVALNSDFEVLLDQFRLEANDPWRKELDTWMSLCHAAVILFSEAALKSNWVIQEATILRWRRARDVDFVLIPVLFPPLTAKDLEKNERFAPLALNEIQMLSSETADNLVAKIFKRLGPLKDYGDKKTPLHELEDLIASRLFELESKSPEILRDAAAKLGLQLPWRSDSKYSRQLARALLSADFSHVTERVLLMAPYFSRGAAIDIIDRLSTFWVDAQAVARVPEISSLPQKQRAICVNGSHIQFTPKSYLSRAKLGVYPWISAKVNPPNGYEEQPQKQLQMLENEIAKQILPLLGLDDEDSIFSTTADLLLASREAKEPLFIIVPEKLDEKLLAELRQRFCRFTFFLLKSDPALDKEKLKLNFIELLEPRLNPQTEEKAFNLYSETKGKVNSLGTT